ncbi:hypothetical protein INT47_004980 [Mucor saturninus]|uniref:J domain-containing protein n=1 Tax=Mucor saturninus TaxID=64648 RepID=A0A8H7QUH7_9FUNG|nr:hypothetical protein INT47_004980 [Mucor saturninus]
MDKEVDYYELLGIEITANTKDIKNAYRKRALKVHPDKNPSPNAAILFHDLTQAQDLLLDPAKRSEYDQVHRSRQERKKKRDEMDSKRRNAQAELEQREKDAKKSKVDQNQAKAQYEAEIARMREEGAKRRQEDWGNNREKEAELPEESELDCALKVKWKRKKFDFSESDLEHILNPIGSVDSVALSQKKKGGAIVVFKTVVDAYNIITKKDTHPSLSQFESIDWATGKAPALVEKMNRAEEMKKEARTALFSMNDRPAAATGKPLFSTGSQPSFFKPMSIPSKAPPSSASKAFDNDYEAITLMKMRQAERDRQILLQQRQQTTS